MTGQPQDRDETIPLADALAAAAARVCAEYDGIHRLRAALSRWYDHRAGIHAPSRLAAPVSAGEPKEDAHG